MGTDEGVSERETPPIDSEIEDTEVLEAAEE